MESSEHNLATLPGRNLSGQKVGDYYLLRRLGSGGMADVYLAVQESLKRNVAIKILKPHLAENVDYVERFQREAQAAAALVHANIVQIFEVGQSGGWHFIAQEYVRGRNLKQYLARYGAVPPDMALSVLRQCAMALQKGTEHDVVHRDIKPDNIMLTANGEIKVTDFGLASIGGEADKALTKAGVTVGTPLYMSPEQIEGNDVDIRSDLYSLGITVYHMLAGEPPFDGDSPVSIAVKHASREAVSLSQHRDDLPEDLVSIVSRMMHKSKNDRPESPMQLLKMLQSVSVVSNSRGFDWSLFEPLPGENVAEESLLPRTEQLASIGSSQASQSKLPARILVAVATVLLCLAGWWGGSKLASEYSGLKNQKSATTESRTELPPRVPLAKGGVQDQYLAALWASRDVRDVKDSFERREMLWQSVLDYFPVEKANDQVRNHTEYYNLLALCRLGELYLENRQIDKALVVYEQLASQEELLLNFRVTGNAGKAIALFMRPSDQFDGGAFEQESLIRFCINENGVREHVDELNEFLREKVEVLLIRFPNYGKYLPKRTFDFASK